MHGMYTVESYLAQFSTLLISFSDPSINPSRCSLHHDISQQTIVRTIIIVRSLFFFFFITEVFFS